jgi:hypothetical protein
MDWEGYWWKAVPVDMDKYTAQAELCRTHGYFVRSMPGKKTVFPLQACLLIGKERLAQNVHNLIIAEENSELHLITGCSTSPKVSSVLHLGISEFFVERNAKITFTMIHFWPQKAEVRPRTGVVIKENGTFISNYICMSPARSLQMFPTAFCKGKNARAVFQTVVSASGNSVMDIGTKAVLEKGNCRAEILTKVIAEDGAEIIARGHLVGNSPETKAHLECRGLLLSPGASIQAIPQLEAKTSGAELSHEAAIGKISDDEIRYLMARGLTSDEATSLIVSGFLKVDTGGLPPPIRKEIDRVMGASM